MSWFEWAEKHLAKWKLQATAPNEFANRFTPRAQQAFALARREAERLKHNYVGTEHVLLGIIKLGQGVAVNVLQKIGLDLEAIRSEVEKLAPSSTAEKLYGTPYTPRTKKVLALAQKHAKSLNHAYVGTEHILLGLLAEGDGVAGRVLKKFNLNLEHLRKEILIEINPNFSPGDDEQKGQG